MKLFQHTTTKVQRKKGLTLGWSKGDLQAAQMELRNGPRSLASGTSAVMTELSYHSGWPLWTTLNCTNISGLFWPVCWNGLIMCYFVQDQVFLVVEAKPLHSDTCWHSGYLFSEVIIAIPGSVKTYSGFSKKMHSLRLWVQIHSGWLGFLCVLVQCFFSSMCWNGLVKHQSFFASAMIQSRLPFENFFSVCLLFCQRILPSEKKDG